MTTITRLCIAFTTIALTFAACGKKDKSLTPAQVNAKADSILQSKMSKLKREAREDLDRRLPIEVKPKVDSILRISHEVTPVPVFPEDHIGTEDMTDTGSVKK